MFGVTTIIAFWKYGFATQPSILETLPSTVPLHIAAILVAIQLCLTSAVSNSALYQQMEDCMGISRDFNPKRCILRTTLTILAVVLAESVPKFDLVMSIIGGTLTGPLVFFLPPLIFVKMRSLRTKHEDQLMMTTFSNIIPARNGSGKFSKNMTAKLEDSRSGPIATTKKIKSFLDEHIEVKLCIFITIASVILTASTTYFNLSSASSFYTNITKPCIYNVSLALLYL
ncbi:hypothetical protein JTB14_001421 [Gonioctena quinquepunctata]|nr:hypothetical protein JTB14_001421 [Gonioctena quinquepunctata]